MSLLSSLLVKLGADTTDYDKKLTKAERQIKAFGQSLTNVGTTMAAGITLPLLGVGAVALKSAATMDSLMRGLTAVSGSAEKANQQFARLKEVAKLPGLGLEEAVRGSINLQAAGLSAIQAERALLGFGNALATVGKGKAELDGVITALTQIASKGKISAEEINQLAERVPQIRKIMEAAFGTSNTEVLQKMGISADEFINKITEQALKIEKVTGGIGNSFENLQDSGMQAFASLGKLFVPAAQAFIDGFAVPAIAKMQAVVAAFEKLTPVTQSWIATFSGMLVTFPLVVLAIGKLVTVLSTLNFALVKTPAGLAVMAAALGISYIAASKFSEGLAGVEKQMRTAADTTAERATNANTHWAAGAEGARQKAEAFRESVFAMGSEIVATTPKTEALGKAVEQVSWRLKTQTAEGHILASMLDILKGKYNATADSIAALRLAGAKALDMMPRDLAEINEELGRMKGLLVDTRKEFPLLTAAIGDPFAALKDLRKEAEGLAKITKEMGGRNMDPMFDKIQKAAKSTTTGVSQLGRQVSMVLNDVARDLTDLIFKGGKFKDVMVNALESMGKALVRLAIETQLQRIATAIAGLLSKIPALGKALDAVFGVGSGAASAAGGVASAAGGVASAAGGAGSAAGSSAGGAAGAANIVGAVAGVVTAISSVISNFQFAGMNKSLDLIEKETRYSQIHLLHMLEKHNEYLPFLKSIHERWIDYLDEWRIWTREGLRVQVVIDGRVVAESLARQMKLAGV